MNRTFRTIVILLAVLATCALVALAVHLRVDTGIAEAQSRVASTVVFIAATVVFLATVAYAMLPRRR